MKDLLITIYGGGDEAVAAVQRMGDDWRAMLEQAASEIEALRLTDAEREAAMTLISCGEQSEDVGDQHAAATLRGLLERLGGGR